MSIAAASRPAATRHAAHRRGASLERYRRCRTHAFQDYYRTTLLADLLLGEQRPDQG